MNIDTSFLKQLNSFTSFAEVHGEGSKTVARTVDVEANGGAVQIEKNGTDKPYAFSRSTANKEANNNIRNLFRKTIAGLFRGEENIPAEVKTAMKLGDYDSKGHPLTARRILAVKTAIDRALSNDAFDEAVQEFGKDLSPDEVAAARRMFNDNLGSGMPPMNSKMLARYILSLPRDEGIDVFAKQVATIAKDIAAWRDIDFGDPAVAETRDVVEREIKSYAQVLISQNDFADKDKGFGNICKVTYADANRADYTIAGQNFPPQTDADKVVGALVKAIPSAKAQKLVSATMNQSLPSILIYMGERLPMTMHDGSGHINMANLQGGNRFVGRSTSNNFIGSMCNIYNIAYTLTVSEDGKSATLQLAIDSNLMVAASRTDVDSTFGRVRQEIKIDFDLSNEDDPKIASVDIAQRLSCSATNAAE